MSACTATTRACGFVLALLFAPLNRFAHCYETDRPARPDHSRTAPADRPAIPEHLGGMFLFFAREDLSSYRAPHGLRFRHLQHGDEIDGRLEGRFSRFAHRPAFASQRLFSLSLQ